MDFEFPCPTCQNKIKAQDNWIGMSARCPTCDSIITVPKHKNIDTQVEAQKENETVSNSKTKSKLIKCSLCNNEISSYIFRNRNTAAWHYRHIRTSVAHHSIPVALGCTLFPQFQEAVRLVAIPPAPGQLHS